MKDVKEIWTDKEFQIMDWHDCHIHSITFPDKKLELSFDIDYIFKWELDEKSNLFNFWISPCTLIFFDVLNLKIDLDFENFIGLDIKSLNRTAPRLSPNNKTTLWDYSIITEKGVITFESSGYMQKTKKQPILSPNQTLSRNEL